MPSASGEVFGITEARLSTPPLRDLGPATSAGYECIRFAESVLGVTLDPWQQWFLIRALELNPDGTFRFRTVLLLVARQNGKTVVAVVMALWFMYTGRARTVLGCAQSVALARETWNHAVWFAKNSCAETAAEVASVRYANGEQELALVNGARYVIKALNRAVRGLSVDFLFLDEVREQRSYDGYAAASATTSARPNAIQLLASNAGDDQSVLLNGLRDSALTGDDDALGIFEWSALDDCDPDDMDGIRQANPSLGHGRLSMRSLRASRAAISEGHWRTEHLCQRVQHLDTAVDMSGWRRGADGSDLADLRDVATVGFDVSMDGNHATLYAAAAHTDGTVVVQGIAAWDDLAACHDELPAMLDAVAARQEAWFPTGPGAEFAYLFGARTNAMAIQGGQVAGACQSLAGLVAVGRIKHGDDALLDSHLARAGRQGSGDTFRFTRRGGPIDACYAVAGAVYAALTVPVPKKRTAVML